MTGRFFGALAAAGLLLATVVCGQWYVSSVSTDLAHCSLRVCVLLSREDPAAALPEMEALSAELEACAPVLRVLWNDKEFRELHRTLAQGRQAAEAGEWKRAEETLFDFYVLLRDLQKTYGISLENILKIHESFGIES